jgi:hypothetical protein
MGFYSADLGANQIYDLGYHGDPATDCYFADNWFIAQSGIQEGTNTNFGTGTTFEHNVVTGLHNQTISDNTYSAAVYTTRAADIFQRVNPYESNRANVTIYNWKGDATVKFLPTCLTDGTVYRLVTATNFYGAVVDSNVWHTGDSITVDFSKITMATPIGTPDYPAINPQPYFASLILLGSATAGSEAEQTAAPTVTGGLVSGNTSVSGTSESGATITVYVNGGSVGTTTASGTSWTKTVTALSAGDQITATALASGKTESEASNVVTVTAAPAATIKRLWKRY